ncbi:MAG: hypothetical protein E2585_00840 [Comamonas sp.]|nr:hypothetical protein [Comamonas sp.]
MPARSIRSRAFLPTGDLMPTRNEHHPIDDELAQRLPKKGRLVKWPRIHTPALALLLAALLLLAPALEQSY